MKHTHTHTHARITVNNTKPTRSPAVNRIADRTAWLFET